MSTPDDIYIVSKRTVTVVVCTTAVLLGVGFVTVYAYLFMPFSWGEEAILVDDVTSHLGVRMLVMQRYTGDLLKPFQVRFFYRTPEGIWYSHWLEGDALYWRGRIDVQEEGHLSTIFNYGTPRGQLFVNNDGSYEFTYGCPYGRGATIQGHGQLVESRNPIDKESWK